MNSSPERQIRKFNPGTFQSNEEVIAQFVVRNRELGIVFEVLRGYIDSPSCQHILVVAPRGRGKSMLLARVAARHWTLSGCIAFQRPPARSLPQARRIPAHPAGRFPEA